MRKVKTLGCNHPYTGRLLCGAALALLFVGACPSVAHGRTVTFAGREWAVRSGEGGPGPNKWSDSEQSVWVNDDGLHLKIRNAEGVWYCAEVTSVLPTHYGMHRFYAGNGVDRLDRNVVASPFLYKDDAHEVDIEFSTWGVGSGRNTQYVVQPCAAAGNIHRFEMIPNCGLSTHCFDWHRDSIHFMSYKGHSQEVPAPEAVIQDWTYTGKDTPPEGDNLHIHINIWLIKGAAPSDGREADFVVKDADLPEPPRVPTNSADGESKHATVSGKP